MIKTPWTFLFVLLSTPLLFAQELTAPTPAESKFDFRVGTIYGTQNYDLKGDGFSTTSGIARSSGFQVSGAFQLGVTQYWITHQEIRSVSSTPDDINPGEVSGQLQRTQALVKKGATEMTDVVFGLEMRKRSAGKTTPNVFLPTSDQLGAYVALTREIVWSGLWSAEMQAGFFVPIYHDERSAKTGNYKFSLDPDFSFDLVYKVNEFIDFSIGSHIVYEYAKFSASGARGSENATETYTNIYFPIELRFQF